SLAFVEPGLALIIRRHSQDRIGVQLDLGTIGKLQDLSLSNRGRISFYRGRREVARAENRSAYNPASKNRSSQKPGAPFGFGRCNRAWRGIQYDQPPRPLPSRIEAPISEKIGRRLGSPFIKRYLVGVAP